jgi:rRNA pseudouridine-1189 N-methylase Emg1 (Nep1/Mra1 family)
MSDIKQTVIKTTNDEVVIEVEADTIADFLECEAQDRIKQLDDVGPFGPRQAMSFITTRENMPIYIVLILCVVAHIWARATIGM